MHSLRPGDRKEPHCLELALDSGLNPAVYSPAMKLLLKNLRNGQVRFEDHQNPALLDLDQAEFSDAVDSILEVKRGERWLRFELSVATVARTICDRCAVPVQRRLQTDFVLLAHEGEQLPGGTDPDEVHLIRPEDDILDLSLDLRDEIMIARESPCLCKEECRGLCAGCGRDLNTEE